MNDESYYKKPAGVPTRTGAGGAVARLDGSTGRVLVALIRPPDQDEWVLPKGGVDGDESLEDAARREIEEEAGFTKLRCLGKIGAAERLNGRKVWWQKTHYFLFLTDQEEVRPTEHRDWEVGWFPPDRLPEMRWRDQREVLENARGRIVEVVEAAARNRYA